MDNANPRRRKAKHFIEQPQYPGGRKAINEFIRAHLQYPEDAEKQRIEGVVTVEYQVNDEGGIENVSVLKGLCPSCDAEAARLVRLLKYGKATNRGLRVKSNCKLHIHFKLAPMPQKPTTTITYTTTPSIKKEAKKNSKSTSYTLIIKN